MKKDYTFSETRDIASKYLSDFNLHLGIKKEAVLSAIYTINELLREYENHIDYESKKLTDSMGEIK